MFHQMALHRSLNYISNTETEARKPFRGAISSELPYCKSQATSQTNSIPPSSGT